jgi:hypothetical protein
MAVDERDIDAWLELFVSGVIVGNELVGREALRDFTITSATLPPVDTPDCRPPHRADRRRACYRSRVLQGRARDRGRWIVIAIRYDDEYQKINGNWYFVSAGKTSTGTRPISSHGRRTSRLAGGPAPRRGHAYPTPQAGPASETVSTQPRSPAMPSARHRRRRRRHEPRTGEQDGPRHRQ